MPTMRMRRGLFTQNFGERISSFHFRSSKHPQIYKTLRGVDLQIIEWEKKQTLTPIVYLCCWLHWLVLVLLSESYKIQTGINRVWQELAAGYLYPERIWTGLVYLFSFIPFSYRLMSASFWGDNILNCSLLFGRNSVHHSYSRRVSVRERWPPYLLQILIPLVRVLWRVTKKCPTVITRLQRIFI